MKIDPAGYPFIGGALVPAAIAAAAKRPALATSFALLGGFFAYFFRDPDRHVPQDPGLVVSPADGRVMIAGPTDHRWAPPGEWKQITIFLSPMDVHINRTPVDGRVTKIEYRPGKFLPAYDQAANDNELNELWIDSNGRTIVVRQVVGILARRIVCRVVEGQRESLTIVKKNSERLLGLINDLLDVSRMEAGRLDLHRASLDLAHLILEVAGSLRPLIEAKRQRLRLDLGEPLPAVWADADRVTQILTNLISNAHKYTLVEGSITVAARRDDGFVRVDVSDTGTGLSPEDQAQLFTKFFRAHDRSPQAGGGTGLGLVITRLLVELHGGRITVSSAPGRGSTFSFSLPALEVPA